MLENPVKVSEKAKKCAYIFSLRICKWSAYKCKVTAENESVAVKNVYSFFIFAHKKILTFNKVVVNGHGFLQLSVGL